MNSLEYCDLIPDITSRCHPEPTDQPRTKIRQYVSEKIGRYYNIELMRVHNKLHTAIINQHFLCFYIRIIWSNFYIVACSQRVDNDPFVPYFFDDDPEACAAEYAPPISASCAGIWAS